MDNQQPFDPNQEKWDHGHLWDQLSPKKRAFLQTLKDTFGNIAQACDACKIGRSTYYLWMREDIVFNQVVRDLEMPERRIDFVESKLMQKINSGDTIAMIFFLKTQAKHRGYIEKDEKKRPEAMEKEPSWFDAPKELPENTPPAPAISDAVIVSETKKEGK